MKRTNVCPKCSSTRVVAQATVLGRLDIGDQEVRVATFRNPEALIFQGRKTSTLSAWICRDCGYTEFYADSPEDLGS